jgi:hypothetical protein
MMWVALCLVALKFLLVKNVHGHARDCRYSSNGFCKPAILTIDRNAILGPVRQFLTRKRKAQ